MTMLDLQHGVDDKPDITLDADRLAVVMRRIRDTQMGLGTMASAFTDEGALSYGLARSILRVTEGYMRDLGDLLGVETVSAAEIEKRHGDLRRANTRIHELEAQLGAAQSPELTQLSLKAMKEHLTRWWEVEGFGHISEIEFGSYGAQVTFSCNLFGEFVLVDSPTPVSDKELKLQWHQSLRDRGFELTQGSGETKVVDNDANRKVLCEMIKTRIPSARITKVENSCSRDSGFTLRSVEVFITKLVDIFQLPVPPKPEVESETQG
jgi:hypothetical protein